MSTSYLIETAIQPKKAGARPIGVRLAWPRWVAAVYRAIVDWQRN
jgi:hypothetical protein